MVVRPGRTFLRQLLSLMKAARAPHHYVRLNVGARADLAWWYHFLQAWNGFSFFPPPAPSAYIYSDASGSFGCGTFLAGVGWFQAQWPTEWEGIEISAKELVPMVMAAAIWGKQWSGSHVCFHCDNMAVVAILGSRTAKTPLLTHLLRCLSFFSAISAHTGSIECSSGCIIPQSHDSVLLSCPPDSTVPHPASTVSPTQHHARLGIAQLDAAVHSLLGRGLAASTVASYASGKRRYLMFCTQFNFTPLPVNETILCRFVLVSQSLSPLSIRSYLSAVRHLQVMSGLPDPSLSSYPLLDYALRGEKRDNKQRRQQRLPITAGSTRPGRESRQPTTGLCSGRLFSSDSLVS